MIVWSGDFGGHSVRLGTAVAQWLRCYATNWKVTGSIPGRAIGIFHRHNPSDCTMTLGLTQPLTEISTRRISWGKCNWCLRLTTLPPSCAVVMKSGNLNFLEPSGPLQACNGNVLPFCLVRPCCPVHTLCNLLLRHCAQSMPVLQYCVLVKERLVTKYKIKAVVKMLLGHEFYSVLT